MSRRKRIPKRVAIGVVRVWLYHAAGISGMRALVSTKDESFKANLPLAKEIEERMAGRPKAYFQGALAPQPDGTATLLLGAEEPDPGW